MSSPQNLSVLADTLTHLQSESEQMQAPNAHKTAYPLTDTGIIQVAQKVVNYEAWALKQLANTIDDSLVQAVKTIVNAKGRVIISGMGKSGHIGTKIAATLASTGTPAFFVHPAEASHGDLGMVTPDDVVICLSNSGGTTELADLISYTRRHFIPLIAIVAVPTSALGKNADIVLEIPKVPEACPNGLAPTSSTVMMLALGDALAVALMEWRGFTSENFLNFHPGGKLGAKLLKVSEVMHPETEIPLVHRQDDMQKVLIEMTSKSFGCTGVTDDAGHLVGIITDGDLRRHMNGALLTQKACKVMSVNPYAIEEDKFIGEVVAVLQKKSITGLFVIREQKPIGFVHIHDCLRVGAI